MLMAEVKYQAIPSNFFNTDNVIPRSMYGIVTNIYTINGPNVGKYTTHGAYGIFNPIFCSFKALKPPFVSGRSPLPIFACEASMPL